MGPIVVEQVVDVEEAGDRLLLDFEVIGHGQSCQPIVRDRPIRDKPGRRRVGGAEPVLLSDKLFGDGRAEAFVSVPDTEIGPVSGCSEGIDGVGYWAPGRLAGLMVPATRRRLTVRQSPCASPRACSHCAGLVCQPHFAVYVLSRQA